MPSCLLLLVFNALARHCRTMSIWLTSRAASTTGGGYLLAAPWQENHDTLGYCVVVVYSEVLGAILKGGMCGVAVWLDSFVGVIALDLGRFEEAGGCWGVGAKKPAPFWGRLGWGGFLKRCGLVIFRADKS